MGEPPPVVEPRRWGSLIGLVGGLVFVGSSSPVLGPVASIGAWVAGTAGLVAGALGVRRAADAAAVLAGLVMIAVIASYARGRFRPSRPEHPVVA